MALLPLASLGTSAGAGTEISDARAYLPPLQDGPAGTLRDLPVVPPIDEAQLEDLERFRLLLDTSVSDSLGPAADRFRALLVSPDLGTRRWAWRSAPFA
jgi:hypothetical protein